MKRNLFYIFFLFSIAVSLFIPLCAFSTTIAAIMSSDQPRYLEAHRSFVKSIAAHGYNSPSTDIIMNTPNSDASFLTAEIHKLKSTRPDLILTYGLPASLVAVRESTGIPVVSVDVFAPDRPIKGMCGVSSKVSMVTMLRTLIAIRPYKRIGVLFAPRDSGSKQQLDDIKKFAGQLGITVLEGSVTSADNLDSELNKLLNKSDAVVVTEGGLFAQKFENIVSRAKAKKIPILSTMPDASDKGAILSLEINPQEQGYLAAEMAARVLDGANPEFLPLIRPNRIDLIINMRQARAIGIEIPFSVLRSANRLIK